VLVLADELKPILLVIPTRDPSDDNPMDGITAQYILAISRIANEYK
jgi:hypothetical protein